MTDDVAAFGVSVTETSAGPVVKPRGDVDMSSADELERVAVGLVHTDRTSLTIDMSGVGFCDSAGINSLVRIKKACDAAGGQFAVSGPQQHVRHVLTLSGLIEYLNVEPAETPASGTADGELHH